MEIKLLEFQSEIDQFKNKYYFDHPMKGNVCHYTGASALESIIKNNTLWVTKSDFLNDKTEYLYGINLINKILKNNDFNIEKELIDIIINHCLDNLARSFVFSISLNNDSVNLWANYSDNEGYNIGISLEDIFHEMWEYGIYVSGNKVVNGENEKIYLQRTKQYESIIMTSGKVIYNPDEQTEIILDILKTLENLGGKYYLYKDEIKGNDIKLEARLDEKYYELINRTAQFLTDKIQLFKNPLFKLDEEYRITFDINKELDVIKYRQTKGIFMPYIEVVFENKIPINSVTIGPKINIDIAEKGLRNFLISRGYDVGENGNVEGDNLFIKPSNVPLRY